MGALLTRRLIGLDLPGGLGELNAGGAVALTGVARDQFAAALHQVFVTGLIITGGALGAAFFLPPVDFHRGVAPAAGEQMLAAEMANLEPRDEPVAVPD
jgi:hypothetical protein